MAEENGVFKLLPPCRKLQAFVTAYSNREKTYSQSRKAGVYKDYCLRLVVSCF